MLNSTDNMSLMLQPEVPVPSWVPIFDMVQLAVAIIGVISNLATLITLSVNGEDFSNIIRMLFQYQSVVDCLCCLQACLVFTLPPMWVVGNAVFDTLVCQLWHSQCIYSFNTTLSIYNLITLAIERYLCICHPLKYNTLTRAHFRGIIVGLVFIGTLNIIPTIFQVRMRDGECMHEYMWDDAGTARFFTFYAYQAFFMAYAIPAFLLVILYSLVILSFRKRAKKNLGASGTAGVIDKATSELTKTAIVVTLIFIVCIGVDLWYYILGYMNFVEYVLNSPIQKIALLFAVLNSVANPFVYASFMPIYRKSVKKTFFNMCSED